MSGGSGHARQQRFLALCEPCRADVFRLWLARSRAVAEKVVQETFLRAWKSLDSLQDGDSAKSWLLTIARELGITEGAVSTRLFRARNRLRARLGLGPDESNEDDDAAR